MLYRKHLTPWLLVYLIVSVFLFLCTSSIIVLININELSGVKFTGYNLIGCSLYIYIKLQANIQMILQICFVFSILSTVFVLGQLIFIIYQFIMFKKFSDQNDQDEFTPFKEFTIKKLILLYVLNVTGLLSIIPIFGYYLSSYIQLNTCQQSNFSASYLIPWIIAIVALLAQLSLLIFTMKFFYHYREQQINQELAKQADITRKQQEQKQMQQLKKKIINSRKTSSKNRYPSESTDQQTPRDIDTSLLDKMQYDPYNARQSTIYDPNNNIKKQQTLNASHMSPNSISAKQKQVMKTLPKHPFKHDKMSPKYSPNDVIFQENYSEQNGSLDQKYQFQDPKNLKLQNNTQIYFDRKQNMYQGKKENLKSNISEIFRQRYLNSPYLKDLKDKNITPEERRRIKRPFLKLSGPLIQFDARRTLINNRNLQMQKLNEQIRRNKNSKSPRQTVNKKFEKQRNVIRQQQSKSPRLSKSRSSAYYMQKSLIEGRKLQNQNPLINYINDDEGYEDHLNRISDFQKLSKKRRRTFASNPFFPIDNKEDAGKLYLHKNKHDSSSNIKNNGLDEQNEDYDPFRDEAYDKQLTTHRGLLVEDQSLRNSNNKNVNKNDPKKSSNKQIQTPMQTKKSSRKDANLLDFIRSKHVID